MKKNLILLLLLLAGASLSAQTTVKYYIDGHEVSEETKNKLIQAKAFKSLNIKKDPTGDNHYFASRDEINLQDFGIVLTGEKVDQDPETLLKKGDMAVNFTVDTYNGKPVELNSLRGKVVLITFWGSWCPPCLAELSPDELPKQVLQKFSNNKDFAFLPISVSEDKAKLEKFFASERGQKYLYLKDITGIDTNRDIFKIYATQSVPRVVLVGRDGKILYTSSGYNMDGQDLTPLANTIEEALKSK